MEKLGRIPTDPSIDYFAGYFDGEGCIAWSNAFNPQEKSHRGTATARIGSTNLPILMAFQRRFGGRVWKVNRKDPRAKKWRQDWTWKLGGKEARSFLLEIAPCLREKREQALLALKACRNHPEDRAELLFQLTEEKHKEYTQEHLDNVEPPVTNRR